MFVVDDHPLFAQGTVEILDRLPGVRAVGFALGLEEAVEAIGRLTPDVVVCDVMLGAEPSGLGLPAMLGGNEAERPPFIFLSQFGDHVLVDQARAAGAAGYLVKTTGPETLRAAILAVAAGSTVFPRVPAGTADSGPRTPSPRELEVLNLVADGRSNSEIGLALGIGEHTVETHLERMRDRYGLPSRTQLAVFADRQGWLSPTDSSVTRQR